MAKAIPNQESVSRRTVINGAASLPVLALALPAEAATGLTDDERLDSLIVCSLSTGLSLDLLEAVTRDLDKDAHHKVLENFKNNLRPRTVLYRHSETRDRLDTIDELQAVLTAECAAYAQEQAADVWGFHASEQGRSRLDLFNTHGEDRIETHGGHPVNYGPWMENAGGVSFNAGQSRTAHGAVSDRRRDATASEGILQQ